jgi:hypothetical protein
MRIKDCGCRGRPEEKPVAPANAILAHCCPRCRGAAVSDFQSSLLPAGKLRTDLYEVLGDAPPSGQATVVMCPACDGGYCRPAFRQSEGLRRQFS